MKDNTTTSIPAEKPATAIVTRPWGAFKQFANNCHCTVTLMTVQPGKRLSLQSHSGRAELWIVLDDGAVVQVGNTAAICRAGDEFWIAPNEKHRLSCRGDKSVRVLEISFGDWQEEDIRRYADDYGRSTTGMSDE